MNYELPIYDITIDEAMHLGVDEIAFVNEPAIEEMFIAMAKDFELKLSSDDKMILTGPALIPGKKIYRIDKLGNEYFIRFSAEAIQAIVQRYFTQNKQINFNLEHNKKNGVEGVIIESWVVKDENMDQSVALGFKPMIKGTWMIAVKVEDMLFWEEYVKTGKVKGFSIEGAFAQSLVEEMSKIEELRFGEKVSFDYDGVLTTRLGIEMAKREIKSGSKVYIISARSNGTGMFSIADRIGIPYENIFATGSNLRKVEKIKEMGIDKHYDNNRNIKRMLPRVGVNFSLTTEEAEFLIKEILKA